MIPIIQYYAKCNKITNQDVLQVLMSSQKDWYKHKINGYYQSIKELLFHIFDVDIAWTYDLKPFVASTIYQDDLFLNVSHAVPENPYHSLREYAGARLHLDDLLIRLSQDLTPGNIGREFIYKSRDGQEHSRTVWKVLLHMFNHQTHHRGQLAQVLDQANLENDFSNLIRLEV